jgi:hypothetical protein
MGARVSSVYAKDLNFQSIHDEIHELTEKAQYCKIIHNIAYPHVSKTTGLVFQCNIKDIFQDLHIEGL